MADAVEALARDFRVLTFTLAGERTSGHTFDRQLGLDNFVVQIDRVFEETGLRDAVVCGVSYGGAIALRYAAVRPRRVRELVLVSAVGPDYEPDERTRMYLRAPRLLAPLFVVRGISRTLREVSQAIPSRRDRLAFVSRYVVRVARAPITPRLMRDRVLMLAGQDFGAVARTISAPALIVTGEPGLDPVVSIESTLAYRDLLRDVHVACIERTGHLGLVLRPHTFASVVKEFVDRAEAERGNGQRAR
jgi:pimeloyl-ACP methyl ester carboxylesterase